MSTSPSSESDEQSSKKVKSNDHSVDSSQSNEEENDSNSDEKENEYDKRDDVHEIESSKAFLLTITSEDCKLRVSKIIPFYLNFDSRCGSLTSFDRFFRDSGWKLIH